MKENSSLNLTKKEIVLNIQKETGLPNSFLKIIVDDLIEIIKFTIIENGLNIKNFGTFKLLNKKERVGRNPKSKELHTVKARKSISFRLSNFIKDKIEFLNE